MFEPNEGVRPQRMIRYHHPFQSSTTRSKAYRTRQAAMPLPIIHNRNLAPAMPNTVWVLLRQRLTDLITTVATADWLAGAHHSVGLK